LGILITAPILITALCKVKYFQHAIKALSCYVFQYNLGANGHSTDLMKRIFGKENQCRTPGKINTISYIAGKR